MFKDATSYLSVTCCWDFKQCIPDKLRRHTKVFPDETKLVYLHFRKGMILRLDRHASTLKLLSRANQKMAKNIRATISTSVFAIARSTYSEEACVSLQSISRNRSGTAKLCEIWQRINCLKLKRKMIQNGGFFGITVVSRCKPSRWN